MYMRDIGYGNNTVGIIALARIYAVSLGKIIKGKDSGSLFSNCWCFGFLGRWLDLKVSNPQSLAMNWPASASRKNLNKYFKELHAIITKAISMTNLKIYTTLTRQDSVYNILHWKSFATKHLTTSRYIQQIYISTVTAAGNALGNNFPPYYVFKGKRWFVKNCITRSGGEDVRKWTRMFRRLCLGYLIDFTAI